MIKNYLLILFSIACVGFALFNFQEKVLSNASPYILKCEGIVLDTTFTYHITNKNSVKSLTKIRPEVVDTEKNMLLHYRDQNMDLVTPSYWGSIKYNEDGWSFTLDRSFTTQIDVDRTLPFLRYAEVEDSIIYIEPETKLTEEELKSKLFFNFHSGNTNSRFYLQLQEKEDKHILPWYDDGIKRSYNLGRTRDTILLAFNTKISKPQHYNFAFDNTSKKTGKYQLIYSFKGDGKLQLRNIATGEIISIENTEHFQVEDMEFSLTKRYSFSDSLLLLIYIIICIASGIYFFSKLFKTTGLYSKNLVVIKIILVCFLLLGFPVLALAIDYQSFALWRKVALTLGVPLVPFLASDFKNMFNKLKKRFPFFQKKIMEVSTSQISKAQNSLNNLSPKTKDFVEILFFLTITILLILPLLFTKNERIFGYLPTLHYAKILILLAFILIYSGWFGTVIKKIHSRKPKLRKLLSFSPTITLVLVASFITILTADFGIFLFTVISCMLILTIKRRKVYSKWQIYLILSYCFCISIIFFSGEHSDIFGRKFHRLNYTFTNPASDYYRNTVEADKQTFAFQYQALQTILEKPLGIKSIVLPPENKSVSHTDYAVLWGTLDNGITFLGLLILGLFFLYNSCFLVIKRLLLKDGSDENSVMFKHSFIGFVLIMFLLQTLIPIASNLMLPGGFLTGIPFPFIAISIGDAVFIFVILVLLHSIVIRIESTEDEITVTEASLRFSRRWAIFTIAGLLVWIALRIVLFKIQESDTSAWEKNTTNEAIEKIKYQQFSNQEEIINAIDQQFLDTDMQDLNSQEKIVGKYFNCIYFGNNPKKLLQTNAQFYIDQPKVLSKINRDSIFSRKKSKISGEQWSKLGNPIVYKSRFLLNGKIEINVSSPFYTNLNLENPSLDLDLSALINVELEKHIKVDLKAYKNLKVSVLVTRNKDKAIVLNSAFPFDSKHSEVDFNFYPGSVKKTLLASYLNEFHSEKLNQEIFPINENGISKGTAMDWLALSNDNATNHIWNNFIELDIFKKHLLKEFDLPFISINGYNGYANSNWDRDDKRSIRRTYIGGEVRYTPKQISEWYVKLYEIASENEDLLQLLNQPLTHPKGTARMVNTELKKMGIDTKHFIAKTGTLQNKYGNISTAFAIANQDYTFLILIDGIQPHNSRKKSAKHLFVKLLPLLKNYLN